MARRFSLVVLGLALVAVTGSVAFAQGMMAPVGISMNSTLGQILADDNGRTLYWFSADGPDVSNCSDACAAAWPPLLVSSAGMDAMMDMSADAMMMVMSGPLGAAPRADGSMQVTWNHMPLYMFSADRNPGDTNGNGRTGFGGDWSVVSLSDMMM
ncbi:MAG: hypothetical protein HW416_1569 [Chloroflexi bacterium]|nr:hypothetical protein [Chloroflexota bacterium]